MSSTRDAYERVVQLYNAGDLEGLVDTYAEDAILVTPDGITAQGRAAIREQVSRDKTAFPDETVGIDVMVEQGDTITIEYTWAGTNTGPFVTPDGTKPGSTDDLEGWQPFSQVRPPLSLPGGCTYQVQPPTVPIRALTCLNTDKPEKASVDRG